jgi:hypothetical protein
LLMLIFALPRNFSLRDLDPSTATLLLVLAVSFVGSLLVNFYSPHYSAPVTGLIIALVVLSMRQLRRWGATGLFLTRTISLVCVLSFAARAAAGPLRIPLREFYEYAWYQKGPPNLGREALENKLGRLPGNQLVIVRYKPEHEPFAEWVYNEADIDHAKVVWAREMAPTENQELLEYFKGRQTWLLEADEKPPRISPYNFNNSGIPR